MTTTSLPLLGGLTPDEFLRDYWQKKPLLIRQALPGFESLISAEELAGLACEDEVEARLVREHKAPPHWTVQHGPFQETDFTRLPDSHWTLLVQDAEKHLPELQSVLDPFRFIPDWRIDDLMISCAAPHGSVGPHLDAYDVFLLQAQGQRRWQICTTPGDLQLLPDSELKVLKNFHAEQEWVLEPGDMLYLPPGVAHYGVALDNCLTYSIGFRAPSVQEMLSDFVEWRLQKIDPELRYTDPDLQTDEANAGQLSNAALGRMRELLRQGLTSDDAQLDHWFGLFITEPKHWLRPAAPEIGLSGKALAAELRAGATLRRNPLSRCAWLMADPQTATLFMNGVAHPAPPALAPLLCGPPRVSSQALAEYLSNPAALALLTALYNDGSLEFEDD